MQDDNILPSVVPLFPQAALLASGGDAVGGVQQEESACIDYYLFNRVVVIGVDIFYTVLFQCYYTLFWPYFYVT